MQRRIALVALKPSCCVRWHLSDWHEPRVRACAILLLLALIFMCSSQCSLKSLANTPADHLLCVLIIGAMNNLMRTV